MAEKPRTSRQARRGSQGSYESRPQGRRATSKPVLLAVRSPPQIPTVPHSHGRFCGPVIGDRVHRRFIDFTILRLGDTRPLVLIARLNFGGHCQNAQSRGVLLGRDHFSQPWARHSVTGWPMRLVLDTEAERLYSVPRSLWSRQPITGRRYRG
jgi:hypothetical protein